MWSQIKMNSTENLQITDIFIPPRAKIVGGGHIVFVLSVILSFRYSVILFETLTLLVTFEQWVLELWYFTWIFPVMRHFCWYHYFWPCDLDLAPYFENFNLAKNFWTVLKLSYFTWIFPVIRPFRGLIILK